MTPNTDDRLASIVRALTDVILPSLPPEAGLAQEQVQLCVGHIQILRAQLDGISGYEAEELIDALALGTALEKAEGQQKTKTAVSALGETLRKARSSNGVAANRENRMAVNTAIANLVGAMAADGEARSRREISRTILEYETTRAMKDRRWFAPFGFDSLPAEG